jgi:hypothetical protein
MALLGLFAAAVFLAEAAFVSRFAAPRARDGISVPELFRFRFEGFGTMLFIFARIVLRTTRALDRDLPSPTRLRALDEEASLEARFGAVFALEAGLAFFAFDFAVFLDLLRAVIVKLSTRDHSGTR